MSDQILLRDAPGYRLRLLDPDDAGRLAAYHERNREFHEEWSPIPPPGFFTEAYQHERLEASSRARADGREYRFGIFTEQGGSRIARGELVGTITLTNIVRGVFQNGSLGYSVDQGLRNRGLMSAAIRALMAHAFGPLQLHRLEANVMPRNVASRRVLQKCGFTRVGRSPCMLKIHGVWEDHEMYMALAHSNPG